MDIPPKIMVAGHEITVEVLKKQNELGVYTPGENTITLRQQCPDQLMTTFLHEVLEAIATLYDLRLRHQTIRLLETALFQVLKENKWL